MYICTLPTVKVKENVFFRYKCFEIQTTKRCYNVTFYGSSLSPKKGSAAYTANVGDSRAILGCLTKSHLEASELWGRLTYEVCLCQKF